MADIKNENQGETRKLVEIVKVWENSAEDDAQHRGFGGCTVNGSDKFNVWLEVQGHRDS